MGTRFKQRREHRKLNKVRSVIWGFFLKVRGSKQFPIVYAVSHHSRVLQQQKESWFVVKWVRLLFSRFRVLPDTSYLVRCREVSSIIKTYGIEFRRVGELKLFYGCILSKVFKVFVKGCAGFFSKLFYFKNLYIVRSYKKVLRLRSSLVGVLESRLVSVIWRSFFISSIIIAQKFVIRGRIKVNGNFVSKGRFLLKPGDFVQIVGFKWFEYQFDSVFRLWGQLSFRSPSVHLEVSFVLSAILFLYKPFDAEVRFPFFPRLGFIRSFYFQLLL